MIRTLRRGWERHFLGFELTLGLAGTVAFIWWSEYGGAKGAIHWVLHDNRGSIYGTWASILGALLGFAIATESVVLGFVDRRRLSKLAESPRTYEQLWKVFMSSIRWLGVATFIAMLALVIDRNSEPNVWALYAVVGTGLIASFRVMRTVWILELVVRLLTQPPKNR
jgi:hypothetical protein